MMLDLQDQTVAKKKPAPPDPEKRKWQSKPIIVQLRGSTEFKTVVEELAEFDGKTVAGLFDQAVRNYARQVGFPKPIPKR